MPIAQFDPDGRTRSSPAVRYRVADFKPAGGRVAGVKPTGGRGADVKPAGGADVKPAGGRWRGGLIGDLCCCIIREGVNL
jgi:hypothetical protein